MTLLGPVVAVALRVALSGAWCAAAVLALLVASRTPALADSPRASELLAKAQAAVDNVDFATARKLVAQAFSTGGMVPGELARAHRFAGEVAAAVGDDGSARDHFIRWILLDPRAALAPGVSPKISTAFEEARKEAATLGELRVKARLERLALKVRVIVEAEDPVDLIAQIHVRSGTTDVVERGRHAELPADDTEPVAVTVTALDSDGNEVWKDELRAGPRLVRVTHGFPGWARWPTWTAVAGVSAGVGVYFGWRVGKAEDELRELNESSGMHSYDDAREIEERGRRDALVANVSFGIAGAAAVAAVLTFVLEPHGVELVAAPQPGGAAVSASLRF